MKIYKLLNYRTFKVIKSIDIRFNKYIFPTPRISLKQYNLTKPQFIILVLLPIQPENTISRDRAVSNRLGLEGAIAPNLVSRERDSKSITQRPTNLIPHLQLTRLGRIPRRLVFSNIITNFVNAFSI